MTISPLPAPGQTPPQPPTVPAPLPQTPYPPTDTAAPSWTLWLEATAVLPLLAIDITAFGDPRRDEHTHRHLRRRMYEHLADALALTHIPWHASYHEDRGDGALVVLPPQVDPAHLLDPLAHHLTALLRRSNRLASDTARLRLRLAVHTGRIHHDGAGLCGHPLIHLFRLLEAPAFKRALTTHPVDLGMLVSDTLFTDTHTRGALLNPAAYQPLTIRTKETRTRAWLWIPTP